MQNKRNLRATLLAQDGLLSKKVAVLSGSTIGEIKNIYELYLLDHGIRPEFWIGGFDRYYEDIVFENNMLKTFAPDLIYLHTSTINIKQLPAPSDTAMRTEELLQSAFDRIKQVLQKISRDYGCPVIVNNFEPLPYRLFGNSDTYRTSGRLYFIHKLNEMLCEYARQNVDVHINDINYLSAVYGLKRWADRKFWYLYKYALNPDAIPLLAQSLASITKSIFGKNKKALALDLDNTLWGGIIGDDGADNILLGGETPSGMAYADFQRYLKSLSDLGVLLTVCSKNDPDLAKTGFDTPGSILKPEDFLEFIANWRDKASNIEQIAKSINILPESIVLIDDNPAERELVSHALPKVETPDLNDPAGFIDALDSAAFFEVTAFSAEDTKRTEYYKSDKLRAREQSSYQDYSEYLKSLDMQVQLSAFANISRIAQLINKTNQFNLTTLRMTEGEVQSVANNPAVITISAQLSDKFGDNGIVSALIADVEDDQISILLWVMSCRVFERNLEYAIFDELIRQCKARKIKKITGRYIPTAKNGYVKNLYHKLGFTQTDETNWVYPIPKDYKNKNHVIGV
jgi:FkbH-like protein